MMLFPSSCCQDRAKPWEIAVSMVKVKQVAHRGRHCSEVKSFTGQHLPQDVNNIQVLSFTGILLKLLHVFPVLHRQTDLQREKNTKGLNYSRALFECEKRMTTGRVSDLLWGHSCLTSMQAVQQIKPPNSYLEAERGQEEAISCVQDQPSESSLLPFECATIKSTQKHMTHIDQVCNNSVYQRDMMIDLFLHQQVVYNLLS